jgi:hypothetical protein
MGDLRTREEDPGENKKQKELASRRQGSVQEKN